MSAAPAERTAHGDAALSISDLTLDLATYDGEVKVLDDISLEVGRSETVGIVGETGCGKSVLAKSILNLLPHGGSRQNARQELVDIVRAAGRAGGVSRAEV